MNKSHYDILGININSTSDEIKKNYRKKALKYHPDVCKLKDSKQRFIRIQQAYDILSNPIKRKAYNQTIFPSNSNAKTHNNQPKNSQDYSNWMQEAKSKAERYSNMEYDNYQKSVFGEVLESTREVAGYGCIVFFVLFGLLGLYGFIKGYIEYLNGGRDDSAFVIGLIIFLMFIGAPIFLIVNENSKN